MLVISDKVILSDDEIEFSPIRAQGSGGQRVNKVSSAVHLRFDIRASSLPDQCKRRLCRLRDRRISKDGIIVIKAQEYRSQEKNKQDALNRLRVLAQQVTSTRKVRKLTRPTLASRRKRLEDKTKRGKTKAFRGKVNLE